MKGERVMRRIGILCICIFLISGCVYIDQNLRLTPDADITKENVGHDKKVALRVVDDRDEQLIGNRGYYGFGAKITTEQDLEEILYDIIYKGLTQKGFIPVKIDESDTALKVELRVLEYKTAMGLWTGGNIGTAAVKAIVTLPSGKTYEKSYRGQKDVRTLWAATQETNARVVNGALTQVINSMFQDKELLKFLASE